MEHISFFVEFLCFFLFLVLYEAQALPLVCTHKYTKHMYMKICKGNMSSINNKEFIFNTGSREIWHVLWLARVYQSGMWVCMILDNV